MAVQQTGLTQLGNALQQGASDYANIQLRRQAEERARAQQIADLQDQRAYAESQQSAGINRQKDLALWQARQARIQELISKGFLAQADATDDMKVAAADAAEQARSERQRTEADTGRTNMQASANALGEQINQLYDEAARVQAQLSSIPVRPRYPDQRQIEAAAIQLANEAGENPQDDAVRARYRGVAQKALENAAMQEFFIAQEAADALKVSLNGYSNQISAITRRLEGYEKSGIVPTSSAPPATPVSPAAALSMPAPQARVATPEERAAAAGIAAPTSAPTAAASQNYAYPAASVFGLAERSGLTGSDFTPERFGQAPMNILAAPGRAIDTAGRYGGAALQGILTGDYSVPQTGVVTQAGQALGSLFSPTIEPGDYMGKERARLLNLPRSPDPLPPMQPIQRKSPAFQFGNEYAPGY